MTTVNTNLLLDLDRTITIDRTIMLDVLRTDVRTLWTLDIDTN